MDVPSVFRIRHLGKADIERAYPLVQLVYDNVTPEAWNAFARERIDGRAAEGGIVAIESPNGYLHGLFGFRIVEDALRGRLVECDHLVVPDLMNADRLVLELARAAERIARLSRCAAISFRAPTGPSGEAGIARGLGAAGFARRAVEFERRLAAAPARP